MHSRSAALALKKAGKGTGLPRVHLRRAGDHQCGDGARGVAGHTLRAQADAQEPIRGRLGSKGKQGVPLAAVKRDGGLIHCAVRSRAGCVSLVGLNRTEGECPVVLKGQEGASRATLTEAEG